MKTLAEQHLRQCVRKYLRDHRNNEESRQPLLNEIRDAAEIAIRSGIPPAEADAIIMDEIHVWNDGERK